MDASPANASTESSIAKKARVGGRSVARKPKRSKYHNVRTETPDGLKHASKKEAARWVFLLDLQLKGVIRDLRRQVRYPLHVNGVKVGTYIPDFEYIIAASGENITEDVKSKATVTAIYRRNKKHLLIEYGIGVKEVYEWNAVVP